MRRRRPSASRAGQPTPPRRPRPARARGRTHPSAPARSSTGGRPSRPPGSPAPAATRSGAARSPWPRPAVAPACRPRRWPPRPPGPRCSPGSNATAPRCASGPPDVLRSAPNAAAGRLRARAGIVFVDRLVELVLDDQRQRELERAALADLALDPDAAAVPLDDRLADRQPETAAAHLLLQLALDPVELLEDPPELLLRDADALVGL